MHLIHRALIQDSHMYQPRVLAQKKLLFNRVGHHTITHISFNSALYNLKIARARENQYARF